MMTNLFSIFDPTTPNYLSSNWLSMVIFLFLMPFTYWTTASILPTTLMFMIKAILKEFSPLLKKFTFALIMPLSLYMFVMMNNLFGIFPYIFTASSHILFAMSMALPAWLALTTYSICCQPSNFLAHLIPQGTPAILVPFMVLIETISNIIRPLTLTVRLTANMIAGHLLMSLLSSATPLTPLTLTPFLLISQMALTSLEFAVAFIQAYVFSVLITLYLAEA